MNTPMHRFGYTDLSADEIARRLEPAESGPTSASDFDDALAGTSFSIVTDAGPELAYTFADGDRLTLAEDGAAPIEAGYGTLALGDLLLLSHVIPGTRRGYNVFLDRGTDLVTVIEVWFPDGREETSATGVDVVVDDREVQREIYFGQLAQGDAAPDERHHFTNRLEGKGMYWEQDTGVETLEFYASVISSNFVELTRHADDLSYCSPSDYVMVDDRTFIYHRTESEFSGISTMYAMDLYTQSQVGVRLGFNETDALEYYMFRGEGEVVGQLTSLAPFDEHGKERAFGPGEDGPKGPRTVYRPAESFPRLTEEEVHEAAEESTTAFEDDPDNPQEEAGMMAGNTLPYSERLVGKTVTLRYDGGPAWEYHIDGKYELQWRAEGDGAWQTETYRAFEVDENLLFFGHLHSDSRPRVGVKIALDLDDGLTTCICSEMGTEYYGNEASYEAHFGVVEMEGIEAPQYVRHEHTDELVGRSFTRSYSDDMTSMHLYTTPHSTAWTIYTDDQSLGTQWSAPAIYVKLRDGVYLVNVVEEACNGAETCIVENDKTMRAAGFGFSGGEDGVNLGVIGAIARDLGYYETTEFFS